MDKNVYVFGHKNPDTDSICSSICYAYLKNQLDSTYNYIPVRLGEINNETKYVLSYFNMENPEFVDHFKTQVSDINMPDYAYVKENDSIKFVFEKLINSIGRTLAVADDNERFIGIVSISDIIPLYITPYTPNIFKRSKTAYKNIIETLKLTLQKGAIDSDLIQGNIYLYHDIDEDLVIYPADIVIFNYRDCIVDIINCQKVNHIIICNYTDDISLSHLDSVVMTTEKPIAEIMKSLNESIPITTIVQKEELVYFTTYETIDDVKENMLSSKHRRFPVVDELGYIKGTISRSNLININRKKAILVDHNESNQSANGIENMTILEVIDHHRVADFQTMAPLYFRVEPVGCTCTIVAKVYEENNITIPKQIAGLLLSAILSDTLIFHSPTCTEIDKQMAEKLAEIANVDIYKYGRYMIDRGATLEGETYESILTKDMKRFMFGKNSITISQINTSDFDKFFELFPNIHEELTMLSEKENTNLSILMITDLIAGGTELVATGDAKYIADEAFNMKPNDKSIFLVDVFSRKKQVVPTLMKAAHL